MGSHVCTQQNKGKGVFTFARGALAPWGQTCHPEQSHGPTSCWWLHWQPSWSGLRKRISAAILQRKHKITSHSSLSRVVSLPIISKGKNSTSRHPSAHKLFYRVAKSQGWASLCLAYNLCRFLTPFKCVILSQTTGFDGHSAKGTVVHLALRMWYLSIW